MKDAWFLATSRADLTAAQVVKGYGKRFSIERVQMQRDGYRIAAIFYLLYGLVYLGGAIDGLTPSRRVTFFGFVPWWAFYIAGGLMVVALPLLVWRRYKWFTRIIALGPAGKALALCWRQGRALGSDEAARTASFTYNWFFIGVAITAAVLLFRAGWEPASKSRESDHG